MVQGSWELRMQNQLLRARTTRLASCSSSKLGGEPAGWEVRMRLTLLPG